jgi:hypothetical protein
MTEWKLKCNPGVVCTHVGPCSAGCGGDHYFHTSGACLRCGQPDPAWLVRHLNAMEWQERARFMDKVVGGNFCKGCWSDDPRSVCCNDE